MIIKGQSLHCVSAFGHLMPVAPYFTCDLLLLALSDGAVASQQRLLSCFPCRNARVRPRKKVLHTENKATQARESFFVICRPV